ncbi:MAG: response regulator [Desulfobacterales bacterium]
MTENPAYKIMVVEDEAVIALRLQRMLTKMGYDVPDAVYSGEEALEQAMSLRPDLILMDIMIPGKLDGIAAAKIVKAELGIPVVFLTAFSEDEIIERAKQAEPYGYILKPFQDRELKAAVEIALYKNEMEKALRESEKRFRDFLDNLGDAAYEADAFGNITYTNNAAETLTGLPLKKIIGKPFLPLFEEKSQRTAVDVYQRTLNGESPEFELTFTNGKIARFKNEPLIDKDGRIIGVFGIARDITESVKTEEALKKSHNELEHRVKERTRELEIKTKSLEEINTAMKVLLKKREEDKTDLEDNVLINVKGLIEPYIRKIKKTKLDGQQKTMLNIIESNLNEIISPFTRKISAKYFNLTPQEIRIANMIRHGNSSKKIADILNLSPRTVETHRKNIRSKIGLEGKRANLRSHLLSLY